MLFLQQKYTITEISFLLTICMFGALQLNHANVVCLQLFLFINAFDLYGYHYSIICLIMIQFCGIKLQKLMSCHC